MTLAGTPETTELLGMFEATKLPAPITTLLPTVTLGKIIELIPIKTLLPIFIFPCDYCSSEKANCRYESSEHKSFYA